jgi:hypothetical protein
MATAEPKVWKAFRFHRGFEQERKMPEAKLSLGEGGLVRFQQLSSEPVLDSTWHGKWLYAPAMNLLSITFHYAGKPHQMSTSHFVRESHTDVYRMLEGTVYLYPWVEDGHSQDRLD